MRDAVHRHACVSTDSMKIDETLGVGAPCMRISAKSPLIRSGTAWHRPSSSCSALTEQDAKMAQPTSMLTEGEHIVGAHICPCFSCRHTLIAKARSECMH